MWPVQTLTLLLCLTDEEQLFALNQPILKDIPAIEAPVPQVPVAKESDLVLDLSC